MSPINRKDAIHTSVAVLYLVLLLFFAVSFVTNWVDIFKTNVEATGLYLATDRQVINLGEKIRITIMAVDDDGNIDSSRNDFIEISTNPESRAILSQSKVKLENGIAQVTLVDEYQETIVLTARWANGGSLLRDDVILIRVLGRSS
ncbi:hypothetical protein [[Eubacterium] cellulosolvens]